MELEKAFAEERAVWWTLEERGVRSANTSPRGSLTGARALRRGDFASQRSVSGKQNYIFILLPPLLYNPMPFSASGYTIKNRITNVCDKLDKQHTFYNDIFQMM